MFEACHCFTLNYITISLRKDQCTVYYHKLLEIQTGVRRVLCAEAYRVESKMSPILAQDSFPRLCRL